MGSAAARAQALAEADEEARAGAAGEDGESIRFWLRSRDLAAVAVFVRTPTGDRPPHFLLPAPLFEATAGRAWPAGERPDIQSSLLSPPCGPIHLHCLAPWCMKALRLVCDGCGVSVQERL